VRGKVWDALVDLRRDSPTFLQWHGEELSAENGVALYIPRGFAHGFVSLDDDTELLYLMSAFFEPNAARGARFDDAAFGIRWPTAGALVISERDLAFPGFDPAMAEP
jgi:dTDP-4-dehydrorhamnose 3,5-epimerase